MTKQSAHQSITVNKTATGADNRHSLPTNHKQIFPHESTAQHET